MLFNDISWSVSLLGEKVILLECPTTIPIEKIHQTSHAVVKILGESLEDIVPAYHTITLFTDLTIEELTTLLANHAIEDVKLDESIKVIELPICYEVGLDMDRIVKHTGIAKDKIIDIHLKGLYRSLFIGFTPGFIYADGLDERLGCPRLEKPRTSIPPGSVGIAGNQTGIYSLASPGGWNILGRTPTRIFDINRSTPMLIEVGMKYRFRRITKEQFESWEK